MEDLLYYIGLGLVITISLVRRANKATSGRKRAAGKTPMPNSIPELIPSRGFPTFESLVYEFEEAGQKKSSKPATYNNSPVEAQSLETIIDEEEEYMQKANNTHKKSKGKKVGKTTKSPSASKEIAKSTKSPQTAQNNKNDAAFEEFNLRDAVIYSEIMKPKFEEER